MREAFLTFFYLGKIPFAPGTFGSIGGAVVAWFVLEYLGVETLFLSAILLTIISIKQINIYEAQTNSHDDKSIVIDEVAGVWLALCISYQTLTQFFLSVILFRVFDIYKPSIIGRIDKNVKGGLGVMGDDVVAGIVAGVASGVVYGLMLKFGVA